MKKKALCALLCMLMLFGAAESAGAAVLAGFDPENVYRDWSTNLFFKRMEEKTGVRFEYMQYKNREEWKKAKAGMRAGENLPDVLFKADMTPDECMDMLSNGVLVDLRPLLERHAPNAYALLTEDEKRLQAVTLPDGRVAALPFIDRTPLMNAMWIDREWLDNVKMPVPTTAEELTEVLRAFKERDPNRNGRRDEIPLSVLGAYDLKYLAHAFGITANDYNMYIDESGRACHMARHPNFKSFIRWCRALYREGLLDSESFATSDAARRISDEKNAPRYGMVLSPMITQLMPADWLERYLVLMPLAYEGKQTYRAVAGPVIGGAFAVTTACAEPEKMLRWVDFLYTEEGAVLANDGVEGEDYVVDGDGPWRKTEEAKSASFLSQSVISSGTAYPGVSADGFRERYSDARLIRLKEQLEALSGYIVYPFPCPAPDSAELSILTPMQSALGRYFDESIARFVIGEWEDTEEQWAAFENGLAERRLDAFIAFWQTKLDHRAEGTK